MDLDYDALMAFATFAEHRNFTRAAEELAISQPALHRKVGKLADSLGMTLYLRDGRNLVLTEEGRRLAAHARYVGSLSDELLSDLTEARESAPVTIATGPGALLHLVGPHVPQARAGPYPIRLLSMRGREAAAEVRNGTAHLAVGVFHGRREGLECHDWVVVDQHVIVPENHRLAEREEVAPEDLEGESLIVPPVGHPNRATHERVLRGVRWGSSVEALGYELAIGFVRLGMGLTIVNDFVGLPDGVVGIPITGFPTVTFELAIREHSVHRGARWMLEFLLEARS